MRAPADLLHLLARDHRRLDERAQAVLVDGSRRTSRHVLGFAMDVLAHEASEQLLLHPLVTTRVPGGTRLARARADEERALERQLVASLREDLDGPRFLARFRTFHATFVEHTDREELEVFPALRHTVGRRELRELGRSFATLTVRLPTRVRCLAGALRTGDGPPPLDHLRGQAAEILTELGAATATTVSVGSGPLFDSPGGLGRGPELAGRP
jgi:hypothetical protein